jgi:hypothetical protein
LESLYQPDKQNKLVEAISSISLRNEGIDLVGDADNLKEAINKLSRNKAVGTDKLPDSFFRNLTITGRETLRNCKLKDTRF